jgi:Flp pilus assembly protein TadG
MKQKIKGQRGVAAVEFALILIPLVLLIFGIIEFSVILYDKAEGARAGIVYAYPNRIGNAEIINTVNNYCSAHMISLGGSSSVNTTITRGGNESGDPLTVSVSYTYTYLVLPNFIASLTSGINLQTQTVMRLE